MSDFNEVRITGSLLRDPVLKVTRNDTNMSSFQVCVKRKEPSKANDYLDVIAWGSLAEEAAGEYHAGSRIQVRGTLRKSNFIGSDGKKHISTQIVADEIAHPDDEMFSLQDEQETMDTGEGEGAKDCS